MPLRKFLSRGISDNIELSVAKTTKNAFNYTSHVTETFEINIYKSSSVLVR